LKEWQAKYERLAAMVVPRSANKVAEDDEYVLFSVVVFKRHREEFAQKCRENKWGFYCLLIAWPSNDANFSDLFYEILVIQKSK
jgi:hypothetical protein